MSAATAEAGGSAAAAAAASGSSGSTSTSTSVLDAGTVESRGIGVSIASKGEDEVSDEIRSFLEGSGGTSRGGRSWLLGILRPRDETRAFFTVYMFVTRLPGAPSSTDLHPGHLMRGVAPYFPVVGTFVGVAVGYLLYDLLNVVLLLPPSVSATISTSASMLVVTGCFHEDGLGDAADGFGGGWTAKQIFKIMSDSRLGTFGCSALILYLTAKIQILSLLGKSDWHLVSTDCLLDGDYWRQLLLLSSGDGGGGGNEEGEALSCPSSFGAGPALVVAHTLARLSAPYLIHCCDYVDDSDGPKSSFYSFMVSAKFLVSRSRVAFSAFYCLAVAAAVYGPELALHCLLAVWVVSHLSGRLADRVLGGVMGDFLGATICLCEIAVLSVILVHQQQQQQLSEGEMPSEDSLLSIFISTVVVSWRARSLSYSPWQQAFDELYRHERFQVLLRFTPVVSVFEVWCKIVQSPKHENYDKMVKEKATTVDKERATADDNANGATDEDPRTALAKSLASPDSTFVERYDAVRDFLDTLAKPVGSLGTLEEWAARIAALQRTVKPDVDRVACLIFAADHGVAAAPEDGGEGCSLYPQAVTRSVLNGLENGVAGASVLAEKNNVNLRVVDVGVVGEAFQKTEHVVSAPTKLPNGTKNFCTGPAMSAEECERCIRTGRDSLAEFIEETFSKVVVLGEVGIGNTTASSSLIAALTGQPIESLCGGGALSSRETDMTAVAKKVAIVQKALKKHDGTKLDAADALAKLGGAEIAALVGAMLEASERDVAVLVDGFIATAAALVAVRMSPYVSHVLFLTSLSAEKGQQAAIEKIQEVARRNDYDVPVPSSPALSMGLRMGEATAALIAVPILRSTVAVLSDIATIQEILSS